MLIEASGLTKDFGGQRAVDGLSFTVEPGRVTGFVGPNGAGKSTTLQLMLGLLRGGGRALEAGCRTGESTRCSSWSAWPRWRTGRGRLLADEPLDRFIRDRVRGQVLVRSPDAGALAVLLEALGAVVGRTADDELTVSEVGARVVGDLAHRHRLRLHELATQTASLEAAFLELTRGDVEYAAGGRP